LKNARVSVGRKAGFGVAATAAVWTAANFGNDPIRMATNFNRGKIFLEIVRRADFTFRYGIYINIMH
jgi:hypothetical protein